MVKKVPAKIFVIDTNVLIHDPEAIHSFEDNDVVIPLTVIDELDNLKNGNGEIPYSVREALRKIDEVRKQGNIIKGIRLSEGGTLSIALALKVHKDLREKKNDNLIISVAAKIQAENKGREVIFVSKDTAARIKAEAIGLKADDYRKDKTSLFEQYGRVLRKGDYENGIRSTRYKAESEGRIVRIYGVNSRESVKVKDSVMGIVPKNVGQECAIAALRNPAIEAIALTGRAGSGKTLLSLAAALQQVTKVEPLYDQIIVARPVESMGKELGFLPGDLEEKLKPWMQPIFDNLEFILKPQGGKRKSAAKAKSGVGQEKQGSVYQYLIDEDTLHIEALSYIRGRSMPQRYIIIDEAQNLRPFDIKTIMTRCGEGTKIVFTGDLDQIDTPYLDKHSNGLAYLIGRYINEPEFCYLRMEEGVRSSMADKAARLL